MMDRSGQLNWVLIAVVGGISSILVIGIAIQGVSAFQPGQEAEHQAAGTAFQNFVDDIEQVCRGVGVTRGIHTLGTYDFADIQRLSVSFPTVQAFGSEFNFQRQLSQCQGLEFCAAGDLSDCDSSLEAGEQLSLNYKEERANHLKVFPRSTGGEDDVCYGEPSNDEPAVAPGCPKIGDSNLCSSLDACNWRGHSSPTYACEPQSSDMTVCEELNEELSGTELQNTCLNIDCQWGVPDDGGG